MLRALPRAAFCMRAWVFCSSAAHDGIGDDENLHGLCGLLLWQSVVTADVVDFSTSQRFDRVVSIEMFEHMKNYQALLRKIAGWLKPGGLLFVHIFTHRSLAYHFEVRRPLSATHWYTADSTDKQMQCWLQVQG